MLIKTRYLYPIISTFKNRELLLKNLPFRTVMEGGYKPNLATRIKFKLFKRIYDNLRTDSALEDDELPIENKRDAQEKEPLPELPKLEGLDGSGLLNFFEGTVTNAKSVDKIHPRIMLHFYHTLNSKILELTKDEIIRFLQFSVLYKPKEIYYEKEKPANEYRNKFNSMQFNYSNRHREIAERAMDNMDLRFILWHHYARHLKKGMLKGLFKETPDIDHMDISTADVIPTYSLVFQNIEKMLFRYWDSIDPTGKHKQTTVLTMKDLISVLCGFSVAQEGSDYLYETLGGEYILPYSENMDKTDIDAFLNMFPHQIWATQTEFLRQETKPIKACYEIICQKVMREMQNPISKELFFSLFQGITSVDPRLAHTGKVVDICLVKFMGFLISQKLARIEVLKFLELLSHCIADHAKILNKKNFNTEGITKCIYDFYVSKPDFKKSSISEKVSVLWNFYLMKTVKMPYLEGIIDQVIQEIERIDRKEGDFKLLASLGEDAKLMHEICKDAKPKYCKNLEKIITEIDSLDMTKS